MSVLQQSMVGVHNAPACLAVLVFNPPHWPGEERPRSLDRHGPEPEPFVRPVLGLINPSHDQLAIKGREVWTARPLRIRPRVTGQHPGHRPGLRHAHVGSSPALSVASSSSMAVPLGCVKDHLPDREILVQDQERVRTPDANHQRCRGSLKRSLAY
jgi:hypothetical protein